MNLEEEETNLFLSLLVGHFTLLLFTKDQRESFYLFLSDQCWNSPSVTVGVESFPKEDSPVSTTMR